jgi:farnesyl-diphosphate farnesyltransferase
MSGGSEDLRRCAELLPSVSRTFALTIGVLPSDLRDSVTVAYLLCRLVNVLEDATSADPEVRIEGLEGFASALAEAAAEPGVLAEALSPADRILLPDDAVRRLVRARLPVLRAFSGLSPGEREIIARWVQAMALGMSSFVAR